jgi:cyclic pyranopterin phosphate synthase
MSGGLPHLNKRGEATMINVAPKRVTKRCAVAGCEIYARPKTLELIRSGAVKKGDTFTVAKTAGILAAKRTPELIPLCHPLPLDHIEIRFSNGPNHKGIVIECEVRTTAKTGVEMEALTGAAVAALTLYDMAKGYDPGMVISNLRLIKKTGGKSDYVNQNGDH